MAIVGGLLVARYVTLESELQAVSDRVTEARDRLREAEKDRAAALAELYAFDVEWELDDSEIQMEILVGARQGTPLGVDRCRELTDLEEVPDEAVASVLEKWNAEAARVVAADDIWAEVPAGLDHDTWSECKRGLGIVTEVEALWERYYDVLVEQKKADARRGMLFPPAKPFVPGLVTPTAAAVGWRRDSRSRLVQRRDEAVGKAEALKAELRLAEETRLASADRLASYLGSSSLPSSR